MLVGIVKKNAIMMIDFAIEAERKHGKTRAEAILEAASVRFRPIMMTTMAALMGGTRPAIAHKETLPSAEYELESVVPPVSSFTPEKFLDPDPGPARTAFFFVSVVQGSFFEWAFHRYWLHRPWLPKECFTNHTLIHHQLCKYEDTFRSSRRSSTRRCTSNGGGSRADPDQRGSWALISLGMSALGVKLPYLAFVISFAVGMSIYYAGYEGLHYLMHKPMFPWIERSACSSSCSAITRSTTCT